MKSRRKHRVRMAQRAQVEQREDLERRYRQVMVREDGLGPLMTAEDAAAEPYHRWLGYRQGFSPALVRLFLDRARPVRGVLLDPFSGSGTFVTECARRGRRALGLDVVEALLFLTRARFGPPPEPFEDLRLEESLDELYARADDDSRRAAVLLAAAATVDGAGRPRRDTRTPAERAAMALKTMRADLAEPLPARGLLVRGDARALPLAAGNIGGMLTSPPYLSRYDYSKVNRPMERLFRPRRRRPRELRASPSTAGGATGPVPAAAEEAAGWIEEKGGAREARCVRAYFTDMGIFLDECRRVLAPGAPFWMVLGGADFHREYIPADIILAEMCRERGFEVEALRVGRRLRPQGRRLGGLSDVTPRETLLELRQPL